MIRITDLYKYFGEVQALRGISLEVESGQVVVVIGPSGSGKSTLLRCINHLEKPTGGHVYVEGVDLEAKETNINKMRA
ncbi:MAG: amino acid ABC transporter ATP-binding protein, partial [Anaerolineae bacterium]|nr:amino acid ABC transporter ATP-binding protein [Anaerolineae bacterium]